MVKTTDHISIHVLRIFILIFCSTIYLTVSSQKLAPEKYWIQFTGKNNSGYSIHNPGEFLSPDAINRRIKYNIPVTEEDLPVNQVYIDSLTNLGLKILGTSKWFNAVIASSTDSVLLNNIALLEFVKNFDPLISYSTSSDGNLLHEEKECASLSYFPWINTESDYGAGLKQIQIMNGKSLHDLGYRGRGIKIAVFDAGFFKVNSFEAFRHLFDSNQILEARDFVSSGSDVFTESSHGMSALSAMAAFLPGSFIGTAPEAGFLLLRTEDASSEYKIEEANWIMAAEFADSSGVDIITTSLGYSQFNDTTMNYSYADMDGEKALVTVAAEKAFEKGMLIVASAGNEGNKTWNKITAPSDGKNVLSVGAIDTLGNLAAFSSRGPSYDGRIKPDVMAVGYEATIINSSGFVGTGFGTSFAAPQVSGLTACLWQAFPYKSNAEILHSIRASADKAQNPDNNTGYGIPNFMAAFHYLSDPDKTEKKIGIFPNPFIHDFNLYFDIPVTEIQIINIFGKVVEVFQVDMQAYELKSFYPADLTPGIYLIAGQNKNEYRVSRLIKQ